MKSTIKKLERKPKPFLKWVGGKSKSLYNFSKLYPKKYKNYFEPFLGGGAVFFDVIPRPQKAYLNDVNEGLIWAYKNVRDNTEKIISSLKKIQSVYLSKNEEQRKEFYYETRNRFNRLPIDSIDKTTLLIFLNKTCFNGMYRENSLGEFNIPMGRYKNPGILDEENLKLVAKALKNVVLTHVSFEKALQKAGKGDFVYFDPPYYPLNKTSGFTNYSEDDFLKSDQVRLRDVFLELGRRGCHVMLSNSFTPFIKKLYNGKRIYLHEISVGRPINSVGSKRGKVKEFAVLNYKA